MLSKLAGLLFLAFILVLTPIATTAIDIDPIGFRSLENEFLSTADIDCTNTNSSIPETECLAFVALYDSTDGANWTDADTNQWLVADDPCNWEGVDCEGGTNVLELRLDNNGLTGSIPPELDQLTQLYALDLSDNNLSGVIPGSLGELTKLGILRLNNNQLGDIIPPSLGKLTLLHNLVLANNQLTGLIPTTFEDLTNLSEIELNSNQLTGPIPNIWEEYTSIKEIRFHQNQLTDSIPPSFLGLTTLIELHLSNNQLDGTIPDFSRLDNLEILELSSNMLNGEIPPTLGGLERLRVLNIGGNQLTGSIPTGLGLLITLEDLGMGLNPLSSQIPGDFCDLENLQELGIPETPGLNGPIPDCLNATNLPHLRKINFCETSLSGPIPDSIWGLTNLEQLWLCSAQLEDQISHDIYLLENLKYLDLSRNNLSGQIPGELGQLTNLVSLRLEKNQLEGPIPRSIQNLRLLNTDPEFHGSFNTDIGYNMLHSYDTEVISFLNDKDPYWEQTQTVTPTLISADAIDHTTLKLEWDPINFIDLGWYEIRYKTSTEENYSTHPVVINDRSEISIEVAPFEPDTDYYIAMRSVTPAIPYEGQQNELTSEDGNMIHVKTLPGGTEVTVESGSESTLLYENPDGNSTTVQIPSSAVNDTIDLLFSPSTSTPSTVNSSKSDFNLQLSSTISPSLDFAGNAFALNAFKDGILLQDFKFEKPITITIEYDDTDITKVFENTQNLYYWDDENDQWEKASDTCAPPTKPILDLTNKTLGVSICHLSDFAVFGDKRYLIFLPTICDE